MRALMPFALLMLAFAGCADPEAPAPTPSTTAPGTSNPPTTIEPVVRHTAFSYSGNVGPDGGACVYAAGCAPEALDGNNDVFVDLVPGNLTTVQVNLTWTAASEATATLGLGVMVMCDGCNGTLIAEVQGPSPLVVDEELELPVGQGSQLHLYVWNARTFQDAAGQGFAYTTPEQAFSVLGGLKLRQG